MSATLYLVRHATPDWSRTDIRYDIPPGPPLTPKGESEAKQLGEFLAPRKIARFYASPLERTQRTAQIAAEIVGAPRETAIDLAEWERGEHESVVLARMRGYIDDAFDESVARGPLALVTHGGPIRLLLGDFGLERAEIDYYRRLFDNDNPLPPAGVWRVSRNGNGHIEKPELIFTPQPFAPYVPTTINV